MMIMLTTFLTVFFSVFFAELGDKTQLATMLFASDGEQNRWLVFAASSGALVLSSALAVLLGAGADRWLSMLPLKLIAGLGFMGIGLFLMVGHFRTV
jgi:putative Ca2+/H+ antiporter (TMEM165/GDT1 family)